MIDDVQKRFLDEVTAAAGHRHLVDTFTDIVGMMADAIWSPFSGALRDEVEKHWQSLRDHFTADEYQHVLAAFAMLMEAYEEKRRDFLGGAFEEIGATNSRNGQFFTPASVSRLMGRVNCDKLDYTPGKFVKLHDPCTGAGVLVIEQAECLLEAHVRQGDLLIDTGDIDRRACDMSYVQFSLLGYAAVVRHMDALSRKVISPDRYTPGWFLHCVPMRRIALREVA